MANWHGYYLVELPPGFGATQSRQAYEATLEAQGKPFADDPQPAQRTHGRPSLDHSKFIQEGVFSDVELTKHQIASIIAETINLPVAAVENAMSLTIFENGEAWNVSREACLAYLISNSDEWDINLK